mmetsp:Transcript_14210/g.24165  ORF Transcript_14210/g.24165 Transcript_14210/m.24165 type:complete len:93 (+) Transcript_14210:118-396(+)
MANFVKKNETLVKVALIEADLDYEYPQKIERKLVSADILELVEREEEKIKFIEFSKEAQDLRKEILSFDTQSKADTEEDQKNLDMKTIFTLQ